MNDLSKHKHLKETTSGGDEKRLSRRPMWRSLKIAPNAGVSLAPSLINRTTTTQRSNTNRPDEPVTTGNITGDKAASIHTPEDEKSRLSAWLSQQFYEYEGQTHHSPSCVDDRAISTMSNLSLVSHVSSINNGSSTADGYGMKRRPSSVPTSPTSPSFTRLLLKPVEPPAPPSDIPTMNNNSTPPLSPPAQRLISVTTATMIPPTSPTASTFISDDRSSKSSTTTSPAEEENTHGCSFGPVAQPTALSNDHDDEIPYPHNSNDNDDGEDEDDTFETASGSKSYSEYMDDRLDEINDNYSDSVYYVHPSDDDILTDLGDTHALPNTNEIHQQQQQQQQHQQQQHQQQHQQQQQQHHNHHYDLVDDKIHTSNGTKHRTSSTQALYVNSVLDSMDPEVAQALLEWRRQSLLKIDWFDMFAVKSELWRSSSLFHLYLNQPQPQDPQLSSESSINTSTISLDYKGIALDKAFRSYSNKIDYAKASVLDIDQALQIFSQLYWECNPSKLFRCAELVYIIIHSLMLLNTDVHAGQEHTSMDDFCNNTIELILGHQASIPIMLFDEDGESTWHQTMVECLQSLYKSVKRSSLLPADQQKVSCAIDDQQQQQQQQQSEQRDSNIVQNQSKQILDTPLDTAFDDLFITTGTETLAAPISNTPKKSISTPQKKQKRNRRSSSLYSTPSWTLLRRRDTHRAKVGPYKEGPLSCQLNQEEWKICWVILHHGHLHIYHHRGGGNATSPSILGGHTTPSSSSSSTTSLPSEAIKHTKPKKKFMQHLIQTPTTTANPASAGENNNGQLSQKKEPYDEVDIYLGNTFCEKLRPHVFLLQLMNGSTYVFDCGSESQAASWIRDCNYWAARETKIVLPRTGFVRASSFLDTSTTNHPLSWKRPPPPAGASVLDKKGQKDAIDTYLLCLHNELKYHLQQPGRANSAWQDKKVYLEVEVRKYQCYQDSISQHQ